MQDIPNSYEATIVRLAQTRLSDPKRVIAPPMPVDRAMVMAGMLEVAGIDSTPVLTLRRKPITNEMWERVEDATLRAVAKGQALVATLAAPDTGKMRRAKSTVRKANGSGLTDAEWVGRIGPLLYQNPNMPVREMASAIQCDRTTLYRKLRAIPVLQKMRRAICEHGNDVDANEAANTARRQKSSRIASQRKQNDDS